MASNFCLPPANASKFMDALRKGEIDPAELAGLESAERRERMAKIVGEENAADVNALFESKLLLKDQQRGMVSWAKQVAGLKDNTRADFITKVNKLDRVLDPADKRAFLADLAAQKLGATVTPEEAKFIAAGAKKVSELKTKYDPETETWSSPEDRLAFGHAQQEYREAVGILIRDAKALTLKDRLKLQNMGRNAYDAAAASKGIVASLDNSFYGRQGIKMLFTHPTVWANGFKKSWADMATALGGKDPMLALHAEVGSRVNAMNGKYKNMKLAIGLDVEEAFPTTLPEKIPIFGRFYKASEAAFVGGAVRMRADLADIMIRQAEANGVDLSRPGKQAQSIGALINAMTGRGNIGRLSGDVTNAVFFSARFLASNIETLTAHYGGLGFEAGPARKFARKEAAKNLMKIIGGMATVLAIAEQLWPGSVEEDPRSSDFGKIKIGNSRFDISGGMASLVTVASRFVPALAGEGWSKSSTTGKWTNLSSGKFGARNALDVLEDFVEGKASPAAGVILRRLSGQGSDRRPFEWNKELAGAVTPIPYSNMVKNMNEPGAAPFLATTIADALGISVSTFSQAKPKANPKTPFDFLTAP